jgi:hypothetical protein
LKEQNKRERIECEGSKEKKRKGKEERDGKERKVTVVWFENNFQIF